MAGCNGDHDDFIASHEEFMIKLAHLSPRPSVRMAKESVMSVCSGIAQGKAVVFAGMVASSMSFARRKVRSTTSGSRLESATLRLVQVLKKKVRSGGGSR